MAATKRKAAFPYKAGTPGKAASSNPRRYNNRHSSGYQHHRFAHPQGFIKRFWAEVWDQETGRFYLMPLDGDFHLEPASLSNSSSPARTK